MIQTEHGAEVSSCQESGPPAGKGNLRACLNPHGLVVPSPLCKARPGLGGGPVPLQHGTVPLNRAWQRSHMLAGGGRRRLRWRQEPLAQARRIPAPCAGRPASPCPAALGTGPLGPGQQGWTFPGDPGLPGAQLCCRPFRAPSPGQLSPGSRRCLQQSSLALHTACARPVPPARAPLPLAAQGWRGRRARDPRAAKARVPCRREQLPAPHPTCLGLPARLGRETGPSQHGLPALRSRLCEHLERGVTQPPGSTCKPRAANFALPQSGERGAGASASAPGRHRGPQGWHLVRLGVGWKGGGGRGSPQPRRVPVHPGAPCRGWDPVSGAAQGHWSTRKPGWKMH